MESFIIRNEKEEDYASIAKIHTDNFHHDIEAILIHNLRKLEGYKPCYSQVVEMDNHVVGHAMLTPVKITNCDEELSALMLAPVGIDAHYQNQGLGSKLVKQALKIAQDNGIDIVLVYGGDYYKKFGFAKAKYVFRPNPVFGHGILMKTFHDLNPDDIRGVVHYPHPFDPLIQEWAK